MNQKIETPCPRCGRITLERKELSNGKYRITCTYCGYRSGELENDDGKGVV